jgi:pimeloyl-ACP methyl ester carboxylesterase
MSMIHETREINGRPTELLSAGAGAPLVFLHGGGIVEGFDCFEPLAERFRFVAPLMPGFGQTAINPMIESRQAMVGQIVGVIDGLGIEEFVLVGHSVGGWLASATAASAGGRVRRLILAAPYGANVPDHPLPPVFELTPEEERAMLTNDPTVWEGKVPSGPDPAFDAARALEGQSLGRFMPGPFDPQLATVFAAIDQPTLLLWGDDDKIVPVEHAPAWQSAIPNAELEVFPGAGHLLFHERREAVEAVARFAAET